MKTINLNFDIDFEKINIHAKEAAEKAFLKEIDDFYNNYNSPYRQALKKHLESQELSFNFSIADAIGSINQALNEEIEKLKNIAIANTYLPMIPELLNLFKPEVKLSFILKEIIEKTFNKYDYEFEPVYEFSFEKHHTYDWLDCELHVIGHNYKFTLHTNSSIKGNEGKYQILSMPNYTSNHFNKPFKIIKDDVTIEVPQTANIMNDHVMNILFKLALGKTIIELDVEDFEEWMFPEKECHC